MGGRRVDGTNPRSRGTNPRAKGANPRAEGTNPRGSTKDVPVVTILPEE